MEADAAMTIDELAVRSGLPVRTIREYQTQQLLAPPERRGRVGVYRASHLTRLELVARLQRRGYSLAGIRDLLSAWSSGTGLATVLGLGDGPVTVDETPMRVSHAELTAQLPDLTPELARRAQAVGLVRPDGEHFLVRSPALLDLVADGVRLGRPLPVMLDQIGLLTGMLDEVARTVAASLVDDVWRPAAEGDRADELPGFLARGRVLLLQGVASILADRLSSALLEHAGDGDQGELLRRAVDQIRIGVVTTPDGTLEKREGDG